MGFKWRTVEALTFHSPPKLKQIRNSYPLILFSPQQFIDEDEQIIVHLVHPCTHVVDLV